MTDDKRFSLRLPEDLRKAIEKRAESRLRSINNEIVILLKLGLANENDESKALGVADKLITEAVKK
jgi:hypothetical protein